MRTLKLRNTAEVKAHWAFEGLPSYSNIILPQGEAREELIAKLKGPKDYRKSEYTLVSEANSNWIKKQNPWVKDRDDESLSHGHTSSLRTGEGALIARYLLNSFLGQTDEDLVFGDFIEANWDRLVEAMNSCSVEQNNYTTNVFGNYSEDSLLLIRPGARKESTEAVHALTLAQVKILLKDTGYKALIVKAGGIPARIAALLAKAEGNVEKLPTKKSVQINFNKAFIKVYANETDKNLDQFEQATAYFSKELYGIVKKSFDDPQNTNAGLASTADIAPVAEWLAKNAENFRFYELFALVHALRNPQAMAKLSPGRTAIIAPLFRKAVEDEDAVFIMKLFAESIISAKTEFPTIEQWHEGFDDRTVAESVTSEITMAILSGSSKRVAANSDFHIMRNSIRSFLNN